jgi:dTDP-4-dehydrorhamnose 3,5-epimerase
VIFTETQLEGAFVIEPDRFEDDRGFFARVFVKEEFEARGLDTRLAQSGVSFNRGRGTLRGLHYQAPPHAQAKLVRCSRGRLYDVIVDLRAPSATHPRWTAVELSAASMRLLYVPAGFAHGFLTLEDETEITYLISTPHEAQSERGIRWDDPALAINWPFPPRMLSERDRGFPFLQRDLACG